MFEEFCQMQCVTADTEYIYMIFFIWPYHPALFGFCQILNLELEPYLLYTVCMLNFQCV